ncbi:hypothetical protein CIB93_20700, partial [Streptomyces sp. WZ.A104]
MPPRPATPSAVTRGARRRVRPAPPARPARRTAPRPGPVAHRLLLRYALRPHRPGAGRGGPPVRRRVHARVLTQRRA